MRLCVGLAVLLAAGLALGAETATWEKPKTTRRYLQGPLAERLLVMFREGKVLNGSMLYERDWKSCPYDSQRACGVWLVHGEGDVPFDFRAAEMRTDPDGVPVCGQSWRVGDLEVDLEACSPIERKAAAHVRLKVTNRGAAALSEPFGFLVREGMERGLVPGSPDLYWIYDPRVEDWKKAPVSGVLKGAAVELKEGFVSFRGDLAATWDAKGGVLRFAADLKPGETKTVELVVGRMSAAVRPDYARAVGRTRAGWREVLSRAKDLPLREKCFLVQILQCYARAENADVILPRQGGLQRWVWPWEDSFASAALEMLGYGEYVKLSLDFYLGRYARPDGSIGPFGMGWVSDTATVLGTFSRHCVVANDLACWKQYRDVAARAFRWVKARRAESSGLKGQLPGLFPAGVASDDPTVFQVWGTTDVWNLEGLEQYARAARKFGDPLADEAEREAADYRRVLAGLIDGWRKKSAGRDTFWVPLRPDGEKEQWLRKRGYFYSHTSFFAGADFFDASDLTRVRQYMLNEGLANDEGLYFHHVETWPPGSDHISFDGQIWYMLSSEYGWHFAWRRVGRDDRAREALAASLKYGVTDEYQVCERYHAANPWYLPWSPNSSGAARLLLMLHGVKK